MLQSRERFLPPLWIIVVATALLGVWFIYQLKEIFVLLVVGYSIAYILEPALSYLEKRGINRSLGMVVIILLCLSAMILLAVTAIPTILKEYRELAQNLPSYIEIAREKFGALTAMVINYLPEGVIDEEGNISLMELLPSVGSDSLNRIVSGATATLLRGYSITLTIINLALLPFIVFYLAVDFERIHHKALLIFPTLKREKVAELAQEVDKYVSAFVRGQMIVGFILFLLYAAGLGMIGVELWLLLAVISGFGNMIPYLGLIVGVFLSSIMALVTFGDFSHMLLVWVVFGVVQFLEGTFITPRVLGDKVGLSPLVVILAIVAGGSLFGLLGVFLAVPGAAALRVLALHFHEWILSKA